MLTLYYSPGSCSLAVHIALREAALKHKLILVSARDREHLSDAYAKINPLQRIPTLITSEGETLTEVPALLWHISNLAPGKELLPKAGIHSTQALEWMSLLTSAVHPPFSLFFNPFRWFSNTEIHQDVKAACHAHFWQMLKHVERRLPKASWVIGDEFTLVDPYAAVFYWWGLRTGLPVSELSRYTALTHRVRTRSATREALKIEGLLETVEQA